MGTSAPRDADAQDVSLSQNDASSASDNNSSRNLQPPQDQQDQESSTQKEDEEGEGPSLTIVFHAERFEQLWQFYPGEAIGELVTKCEIEYPNYDWEKAKFTVDKPKPGGKRLLKSTDYDYPLSMLDGCVVRAIAQKRTDIQSLVDAQQATARVAHRRHAIRNRFPAAVPRATTSRTNPEDREFTFGSIMVLEHLPNPQRSRDFLNRLKEDPGIRWVMRKHQFKVGVLMEMDPASNTQVSHEGTTRLLGLNRNQGQVIELRLRTDAYDGYRDYKTIRRTLCHELTHNVHGDHDRKFWDLCHQIEREVDRADTQSGGRTLTNDEFAPSREEDEFLPDHGSWTGGSFVLGGVPFEQGLSDRELRARAAQRRAGGGESEPGSSNQGSGSTGGGA